MYEYGRGVVKDEREAFLWTKKSAEQGYSEGQGALGYMYQIGCGTPRIR